MERLYIGISGWIYKGWAGEFYPPKLPSTRHLDFYVQKFPTVEINASFYRLPTEKMVKGWHDRAPEGFIYAVKGSRFITHMKKLKVTAESVDIFFKRIGPLREHTGPILWQLPPNLKKDLARLHDFLSLVPKKFRHAVEFRHPSWVDRETNELLRKHDASLVWLSSGRMPLQWDVTTDFVYIRFHGLEGGAAHDYTRDELRPWARKCVEALNDGLTVYLYFNNDLNVRAPKNAVELQEMIEEEYGRKQHRSAKHRQLVTA